MPPHVRSCFQNYQDDLNGGANGFDQLVENYTAMLEMCSVNFITLKPQKQKVGFTTANAGGFEVGNGKIRLAKKHMDPLLSLVVPTNVSELRRALGLFVQVNHYVPRFAVVSRPLSKLTGKIVHGAGELRNKRLSINSRK